MIRWMAAAFFLLASAAAHASQPARVVVDNAEVYDKPVGTAAVLTHLKKDSPVLVSSEMARDDQGDYWYKVMIPETGDFGYIRARHVATLDNEKALVHSGVGMQAIETPDRGSLPWSFVIRAMGLGGFDTGASKFAGGFDGEVSFTPIFWEHGYLHRIISLGGFYDIVGSGSIVGGSLIYRMYSDGFVEPEFRARVGFSSGVTFLGVNVGADIPLTADTGSAHFALYLEAGGWFAISGGSSVFVTGSGGLGFHF